MDSSKSYDDGDLIESQLSKSQSLEVAYQESLRNADLIVKDEGDRRLRLRILMLEDENDGLHEQLALGDDRIEALEQEVDQLREGLDQSQVDASHFESELKGRTRELNHLKAELSSMNGVTMNSTKVLTEKLALARELAILKPELEHLRSQSSFQQTVLAEKLALQRQVSTLEVELETEKRAVKKAAQMGNKTNDKEAEFEREVEKLTGELAREKKEAEKLRREAEKQLQVSESQQSALESKVEHIREVEKACKCAEKELKASESRHAVLESKLDQFKENDKARKEVEKELRALETRHTILESKMDQTRTSLRSTKDQLKECLAELSQARSTAVKADSARGVGTGNPRKRSARDISTDEAIGTPDGVAMRGKRPAMKRGRIDHTLVGEKSMFSITPFLNRTCNIAPDTPVRECDKETTDLETSPTNQVSDIDVQDQASPSNAPPAKGKKKAAEKSSIIEKNILGETKTDDKNKNPRPKKSRALSTLEKVTEEEADENDEPATDLKVVASAKEKNIGKTSTLKQSKVQRKNSGEDDTGPTKKRRKLLGGAAKTLFDEDDAEATKRPAKVNLGASRLLGKGGLAGSKTTLKPGLGAGTGFGAFSPLKKDRRGAGASFLA